MKTWMLNKREKIAETPFLTVVKDLATAPSGTKIEYSHIKTFDSVMIVPMRLLGIDKVSFVMVEQYRYPMGKAELEFPGGIRKPEESTEQAAIRELLEETGYSTNQLKFMYVMDQAPSIMSAKTYVYVAIIAGEPVPVDLDASEKEFEMSVREFSADELLKLLRDNEVADSKTVAALAAVLLQSPKAIEYANSLSGVN